METSNLLCNAAASIACSGLETSLTTRVITEYNGHSGKCGDIPKYPEDSDSVEVKISEPGKSCNRPYLKW